MHNPILQFIKKRLSPLDKNLQEIISGSLTTFVIRGGGLGLGFLFNVLIANWLGAENTGVYLLAISIITPAALGCRFGLDNSLLRFVAASFASGDYESIQGLQKKGLLITLFGATLVSICVYVSAPLLAQLSSEPKLVLPLQVMALSIVPVALYELYSAMLRGLKRIRDSQILHSGISRVVLLVGLVIFGRYWGINGVAWVYVVAAFVTLVAGWLMWRRSTPWLRGIEGRFDTSLLIKTSLPLFLSTLIDLLISNSAIIILSIYRPTSEVGIYGAALRVALLTNIFLFAVNSIAAPQFSALFHKKEFLQLERVAQYSVWLITMCAIPMGVLILLFPVQVMSMFGTEFQAGSMILVILCIGQLINAITGPVGYLLIMSGHERTRQNLMILAALVNIGLCFLLIPRFGMIGAAVATASGWVVQNLLAAFFVYKLLNIQVFRLPTLPAFIGRIE